ncbi:MAG: hypothetical protein E7321_05385 [Clostridiales bacterium]|nr:hypothetical protein [Clostridiales bacterium]
MKLKDKTRTVEIHMQEYRYGTWYPDWSEDFFDAGQLPYDEDEDAYIVASVDYCIEMATDWKFARGDFQEDAEIDPDDRVVTIDGDSV